MGVGLRAKGELGSIIEEQRVFVVGGTPEKGYTVLLHDAPKPPVQMPPVLPLRKA